MRYSPQVGMPRTGCCARYRPGVRLLWLFSLLMLLVAGSVHSRAQSCSNQSCRTGSIQLNTGWAHAGDELDGKKFFDSWVGIESDNDPNTTESRRASVM